MEPSFTLTDASDLRIVSVILTAILLIVFYSQKRYKNLPPGPMAYPFIGNILDVHPKKVLKTFRTFRKEYGDLFSIYLGTHLTVVVNGYENLKELFGKRGDAVSHRPPNFVFKDMLKELGLSGSSGPFWKTHRTFALKTLRGLGVGKKSIEFNILEEVNAFLKAIEHKNGKPFDLSDLVHVCVSNVICSIAFGKRFDHGDSRFKTLLNLMKENVRHASAAGPISAFTFLKYLPGDPFAAKRLLRNMTGLREFIQGVIDEHKTSFDSDNLRDYIDVYLKEQSGRCGTDDTFTDEQLKSAVLDLFGAGTETTATSIKWFALYILHSKNVQKKMATEIENVVGTSRLPSLNDKPNLPYCEAVITEVMRCAIIAPLSIIHYCSKSVQMREFTIPKGSYLIQNLDSVMKDPSVFQDPEEFQPERFIDAEGKFGGQDMVIPFSIGRRVCLGESLARAELFLFCTSLIQRFTLSSEKGKPLPALEGNLGIVYEPNSYNIVAVKRE